MYENFTEALKQLFSEDETIVEIGPGIYVEPAISILQNIRPELYIAIDGAFSFDDCFHNFYQVGGIKEYIQRIRESFGRVPNNLLAICSFSHFLPLNSKSSDNILFVETLWKLVDGALNSWDKIKDSIINKYRSLGISHLNENEYKKLTILTYEFLTLEEARRVGRKGIAIIPESNFLEEERVKSLKIYSEITGNEFYLLKVKRPTWTIKENGKEVERGHWQDNSSHSVIYLYINDSKPVSRNEIIDYLERSNLCKSEFFKNLCCKLS
jgi:hypothetical protein